MRWEVLRSAGDCLFADAIVCELNSSQAESKTLFEILTREPFSFLSSDKIRTSDVTLWKLFSALFSASLYSISPFFMPSIRSPIFSTARSWKTFFHSKGIGRAELCFGKSFSSARDFASRVFSPLFTRFCPSRETENIFHYIKTTKSLLNFSIRRLRRSFYWESNYSEWNSNKLFLPPSHSWFFLFLCLQRSTRENACVREAKRRVLWGLRGRKCHCAIIEASSRRHTMSAGQSRHVHSGKVSGEEF